VEGTAFSGKRPKEEDMRRILGGTALVVVLATIPLVASALATPPVGVKSTLFAAGTFDELEAKTLSSTWQARISTKGATDVHILENRIEPGGTFGWHSHPGPSIVVVKSGELTLYRADDPSCTPKVVGAGSGFVDNGGDVHVVRNEGAVETIVYVTSLVPKGAVRRIDEPSPGNCSF
jgi:quercetin dioxygenase-like cupin family protein